MLQKQAKNHRGKMLTAVNNYRKMQRHMSLRNWFLWYFADLVLLLSCIHFIHVSWKSCYAFLHLSKTTLSAMSQTWIKNVSKLRFSSDIVKKLGFENFANCISGLYDNRGFKSRISKVSMAILTFCKSEATILIVSRSSFRCLRVS